MIVWIAAGILIVLILILVSIERLVPHITRQLAETNSLLTQIKSDFQRANERLSSIASDTDRMPKGASEWDEYQVPCLPPPESPQSPSRHIAATFPS